jgi:hypothetical protein
MSEAQTPRNRGTDSSGQWSDEEIEAAARLAEEYDDEFGRLCARIAQSADSGSREEAN